MTTDLKGIVTSLREAADDIEAIQANRTLAVPPMFVEPDASDGRRCPNIRLVCADHSWYFVSFAWEGGGAVSVHDLLTEVRKHMGGHH